MTIQRKKRQKTIICVCGMTGSGKSTVAKRMAEKYKLRYLSGGGALKNLAMETGHKPAEIGWWETDEGVSFLQERKKDPSFDKKVDEKLLGLSKKGNVVLDSWTMPWLLKEGFKVWLEASPAVRARRVAKRDSITIENAKRFLKDKDEGTKAIFRSIYGFDLGGEFSPFDLILDTDDLTDDEVFEAICLVVDRLVFRS